MRIAVSGTHFIGKSTLIDDFLKIHPEYKHEIEPYHDHTTELSLEPSLESLCEQLDGSIELINKHSNTQNIIFDRCPVDFLAYAMCISEQEESDINDTEIADRFADIKTALNNVDLIVFLPISKENDIIYTEENPAYRKLADKCFKKLYRDEVCDIFPGYNHPRIIEVVGERAARVKIVESYLVK